ncbi:hypothetical protein CPB84DRAFT_1854016 [Gymnopilus junonius]|uniref:Uncharacterized protein n=1 Tax=Gymnopilus junonius TaxID=109634 RepID=A0A9P5TGV7_GYMJU|nr:hypothetical protein CPB84DRAFT_1854016 [Gymnopilus junonius]
MAIGCLVKNLLPEFIELSAAHAYAITYKKNKESVQSAVKHSMQEESAMDESMNFIMLSSMFKPTGTVATHASKPSVEEQEFWDNFDPINEIFSAGVNSTLDASEERKHLE